MPIEFNDADECLISVWAPEKNNMVLHLVHPADKRISMKKSDDGYFRLKLKDVKEGTRYYFFPDGEKEYPDPGSLFQPEGVHGPSEIIDHRNFTWHDSDWKSIPSERMVIYELHTGTFTPQGTFKAIIPRLDVLLETGINTIELMPVAQFPGSRNWGYDAVYPYAVQNSYGGPVELKKLTDACHQKGMAVILDVVYNHIGPEGNYFDCFAPYFTDRYKTPWGKAINLDTEWSDGVREYFSENALYWLQHFHFDGLRFDAIHSIYDTGATHFWQMTHEKIKKLEEKTGKKYFTIAESDFNSPGVVLNTDKGGFGFSAQWLDDFHHALYVLIDKNGKELYYDYGKMEQLAKAYTDGFVFSGEYVRFRKRRHGASSAGIPGNKFVVFSQNHDQVGNRVGGERLSQLVDGDRQMISAAAVFLSPYIPMLFMGEEYADKTPFCYFVSHSDEELIKAVREGRKKEFEAFNWKEDPPDPQDENTFRNSIINWADRNNGFHQLMLNWHKSLIELRNKLQALKNFEKDSVKAECIHEGGLVLYRHSKERQQLLMAFFNFSDREISYQIPDNTGSLKKILDSKGFYLDTEINTIQFHPAFIQSKEELKILPVTAVVYLCE